MPNGGPPLIRLFAALALILAVLLPGALARAQDPAPAGTAQPAPPTFSKEAAGNPPPPRATDQGGLDPAKVDLAKLQEWRRGQEAEFAATKLRMDYFYWNTTMGVVVVSVFIVCFCVMHLFGRATGSFSRYFIVVTAIGTTIFLMVMGYTEAQVAPAFGLLGTILGYIFGKQAGETEAQNATQNAAKPNADRADTARSAGLGQERTPTGGGGQARTDAGTDGTVAAGGVAPHAGAEENTEKPHT